MNRVLIADGHRLVRETLAVGLVDAGFEVVASAADGLQAVRDAVLLQPDLVLMAVTMPVMDGITAAQKLLLRVPGARVVLMALHGDRQLVVAGSEAGVAGFVGKDASVQEIVDTLRSARNGMAPTTVAADAERRLADDPGLTPRERQILQLVADGLTPGQIADRLVVSPRTVLNHLTHAYDKLDVHRRVDAVLEAVQRGVIELADRSELIVPEPESVVP